MEIVNIAINKLNPTTYNPRLDLQPEDKEYQDIKRSIVEFGLVEPLVINKDMTIIGGHQRLKVLKELNFTTIPCIIVNLDKTKEKMLNIALNKIAGDWDRAKLKDLLEELDTGEFDISLTGWDEQEIEDLMTEFYVEPGEDDFDVDKAIEEIKEPICKRGDIWQLGEHRLMCGDATSAEDIKKLMNGNEVKICFTSPPYNMAGDRYRNYDDNLKSQEYIDFNINTIKNIRPYLKGYLFWNISYNKNSRWEWIEIFYRITKETGINFLEKIVWDKGHGTPITSKKQLTRQYEDIYLGGLETEIENELTEAYLGTTLKEYAFNKRTGKGITNYWRITTGNTQTKENSACFPVALPVKAILLMTLLNDNVLDPFIGLGSTLIACEKTKRKCFGMDLEPIYIDVICQRYKAYTNKKAVRLNER